MGTGSKGDDYLARTKPSTRIVRWKMAPSEANGVTNAAPSGAHTLKEIIAGDRAPVTESKGKYTPPILQLPFEVLSTIFTHLKNGKDIATIQLVSPLFRVVAIGTHSLWDSPDFRYPLLAKMFLERSGSAPVYLRFPAIVSSSYLSSSHRSFTPAMALQSHLHHTSFLDIDVTTDTQEMFDYLSNPAPILRTLILKWPADIHHSSLLSTPQLPISLLGGDCPSLTHVELTLPLTSPHWLTSLKPVVVNLVFLSLRHLSVEKPPRRPHSKDFLEVLASCSSNIQVLKLIGCLPEYTPDALKSVTLANLTTLVIRDVTLLECVHILQHLDLPNLASIAVGVIQRDVHWFDDEQRHSMGLKCLLKSLPLKFFESNSATLLELKLHAEAIAVWAYSMSISLSGECDDGGVLPLMSIEVVWPSGNVDGTSIENILFDSLKLFQWPGLRSLTLDATSYAMSVNPTLLPDTLLAANITDVHAIGKAAYPILSALQQEPVFPSLTRLHLEHVDLYECGFLLPIALRSRANHDLPLHELILSKCSGYSGSDLVLSAQEYVHSVAVLN
ncbi:hypothetical protein VNI00_016336 [Paramarasmius palmivorus]|uniref:F-box domain-containing protein n=1 Tax=Paramarasmius palmivorus TaxID=297713 RepID=A0AAW0BE31_9AGAR